MPWWVMVTGCSWLGVGVGTLACGVWGVSVGVDVDVGTQYWNRWCLTFYD